MSKTNNVINKIDWDNLTHFIVLAAVLIAIFTGMAISEIVNNYYEHVEFNKCIEFHTPLECSEIINNTP